MTSERNTRIIDAQELLHLIPYSSAHIWRLEQRGVFPRRVKIGEHRVGWVEQEVLDWIEARMAEREAQ